MLVLFFEEQAEENEAHGAGGYAQSRRYVPVPHAIGKATPFKGVVHHGSPADTGWVSQSQKTQGSFAQHGAGDRDDKFGRDNLSHIGQNMIK